MSATTEKPTANHLEARPLQREGGDSRLALRRVDPLVELPAGVDESRDERAPAPRQHARLRRMPRLHAPHEPLSAATNRRRPS
jgi:hypothetical protein